MCQSVSCPPDQKVPVGRAFALVYWVCERNDAFHFNTLLLTLVFSFWLRGHKTLCLFRVHMCICTCVSVYTHMYVRHVQMHLWRPEEGIGFSRARVIGVFEKCLACDFWLAMYGWDPVGDPVSTTKTESWEQNTQCRPLTSTHRLGHSSATVLTHTCTQKQTQMYKYRKYFTYFYTLQYFPNSHPNQWFGKWMRLFWMKHSSWWLFSSSLVLTAAVQLFQFWGQLIPWLIQPKAPAGKQNTELHTGDWILFSLPFASQSSLLLTSLS